MSFQKRLFLRIPFLICLCMALSALIVPAAAQSSVLISFEDYCDYCGYITVFSIHSIPPCGTAGNIVYECDDCGNTRVAGPSPYSNSNHVFVPFSGSLARKDPTCTAAGSVRGSCSQCFLAMTEPIPALGHDWIETSRTPATCTTTGTIGYSCSRCTETKTETIPELAADHTWVESSRTPATCTKAGSVSYTCSTCHSTKTDPLTALDHDWAETNRVPATCTEVGYIKRACSRCGFSISEEIPALGSDHVWEETNRKAPTETASGLVEYTCSTCGVSKSEVLPALGSGSSDGSMSELLAKISVVLSASMNWVSIVAERVVNNPILLIMVILGFLGTGVLLFRRLLNL